MINDGDGVDPEVDVAPAKQAAPKAAVAPRRSVSAAAAKPSKAAAPLAASRFLGPVYVSGQIGRSSKPDVASASTAAPVASESLSPRDTPTLAPTGRRPASDLGLAAGMMSMQDINVNGGGLPAIGLSPALDASAAPSPADLISGRFYPSSTSIDQFNIFVGAGAVGSGESAGHSSGSGSSVSMPQRGSTGGLTRTGSGALTRRGNGLSQSFSPNLSSTFSLSGLVQDPPAPALSRSNQK